MNFFLGRSLHYTHDLETLEKVFISKWKNVSQINFNYNNFFFLNLKNLNFFDNSKFVQENSSIFTDNQSSDFLNFEIRKHLPATNEVFLREEQVFENYLTLRKYSFIDFFINNMIDVPICFKKSKSLKTKNSELFFFKFSNLIMQKGKKEKIFRILLKSFFFFFDDLQKKKIKEKSSFFTWFELFFVMSNKVNFFNTSTWVNFYTEDDLSLPHDHFYFENAKNFNLNSFIKSFINTRLVQLTPMFTYFIYNVDKNIRKYTRGKSGKYVFVWKYIAPYKRKHLMFRWFLKEIKFDESRQFGTRLSHMFEKLTFKLNETYAWRAKNYTYTFIFKNFRKTFMTSLKTVAK